MTVQDQIISDVEAVEAVLSRIERATAGMDHPRIDGAADALLLAARDWLNLVADISVDRVRCSL